jgi:hypothetical protein
VTGLARDWNPNANAVVHALVIQGNQVFAGGEFTSIGGQGRNRIASIDVSTGSASAWNPNANNHVFALADGGSVIYAGGQFSNIGSQSRNRAAALDINSGNATSWNPNVGGFAVFALGLSPSSVYFAGSVQSVGGQLRDHLAAVDRSTALPTLWEPQLSSPGRAVASIGGRIYAGGQFLRVDGDERTGIAGWSDPAVGAPIHSENSTTILLSSIAPNPASETAQIRFALPKALPLTLEVVDVQGRVVSRILNGSLYPTGSHAVQMDASQWTPGVYFVRLRTPDSAESRKLLIVR